MYRHKATIVYAVALPFLILAVAFSLKTEAPVQVPAAITALPTYISPIPQSAQDNIQTLCVENELSYELVLAIFQVDGISDFRIANIKAEIASLVLIRNYWIDQDFSNEGVFVLMLLSRQRGIEGCILFMNNNDSADHDSYVQEVAQYKYALEQGLGPLSGIY